MVPLALSFFAIWLIFRLMAESYLFICFISVVSV